MFFGRVYGFSDGRISSQYFFVFNRDKRVSVFFINIIVVFQKPFKISVLHVNTAFPKCLTLIIAQRNIFYNSILDKSLY